MAIYEQVDWPYRREMVWVVLADPSLKKLMHHPPLLGFPKVGALHINLQRIMPKSFSWVDVHWWYDSASNTDAAQGGYLLLVVPRNFVDIVSPIGARTLPLLGQSQMRYWLVKQIMLEEDCSNP